MYVSGMPMTRHRSFTAENVLLRAAQHSSKNQQICELDSSRGSSKYPSFLSSRSSSNGKIVDDHIEEGLSRDSSPTALLNSYTTSSSSSSRPLPPPRIPPQNKPIINNTDNSNPNRPLPPLPPPRVTSLNVESVPQNTDIPEKFRPKIRRARAESFFEMTPLNLQPHHVEEGIRPNSSHIEEHMHENSHGHTNIMMTKILASSTNVLHDTNPISKIGRTLSTIPTSQSDCHSCCTNLISGFWIFVSYLKVFLSALYEILIDGPDALTVMYNKIEGKSYMHIDIYIYIYVYLYYHYC